jgi:hypothetical protein
VELLVNSYCASIMSPLTGGAEGLGESPDCCSLAGTYPDLLNCDMDRKVQVAATVSWAKESDFFESGLLISKSLDLLALL